MIQPTEISPSPEVAKQASPTPAEQPTGKAFAALHAAAVARAKPDGSAATSGSEKIDTPEGETWAAVKPGAHYARIITGPRTGQYINLTHGERRGQVFSIEHRDGKKLHVYGEGGTEVLIKPAVDSADVSDAAKHSKAPKDQPPKNERWAPVAGHNNYADILEGSRNGLYVNISGGVRDGMAFQIVKKGDKVFHVYGTGKDRQMIQVAPKKDDGDATKAEGTKSVENPEAKSIGTGGSAASDGD